MVNRSMAALMMVGLLSFFLFNASASYAQMADDGQLKESIGATAAANANISAENRSPELMSEQLHSQQLEINELKDQVHKLQSMLEAMTANRLVSVNYEARIANATPSSNAVDASPAGPPSPAIARTRTSRELLPNLGHIGAEVGLLVGGSQNPFQADQGFFTGGFIDLPLKTIKGGKLSYEIMIGAQRTISKKQTTSSVIALVNSALNTALGLPPGVGNLFSPLPVTNQVKERLTVLTVVPVSFKYTMTSLDEHNIRPYVVAGLGTYVGLSSQELTDFDAAKYVKDPAVANLLNTLLNGPQVGGLVPVAPELRSRGVSAGQGDFRFGLNVGGGVEIRVSPRFSIGVDYRLNKLEGRNGTFSTFAAKPTVHF